MKRGLIFLSTVLALASCKTSNSLIEIEQEIKQTSEPEVVILEEEDDFLTKEQKHKIALQKYIPLTPENKFNADGSEKAPFNLLEGGLEEYIKKIYIIKDKDFYHEYKWAAAHAHTDERIICLPKWYNKSLLFHEAAHVRQGALDEITLFTENWIGVANIRYGSLADVTNEDVLWKDGTDEPREGCVTAYGSTNSYEDVATFVGALGYEKSPLEALIDLDNNIDECIEMYPLYFCDKNDARYQKKLDLLYEYGFFNYQEYCSMTENLGCLRYLWKN
ncbi:hypothetical protein HY837_06060 [archaeon]|nr:hypothetical protein [archaeon]